MTGFGRADDGRSYFGVETSLINFRRVISKAAAVAAAAAAALAVVADDDGDNGNDTDNIDNDDGDSYRKIDDAM
ncbi:hypothetical protein PoB_007693500 [Plakobranchus ocellatus]|uniref:Uncharacterized protein n=1 Tax=Plakobranchus ocellatus TaxID=259542 RepID=A0AAV4E249_9GAST|nr:hypothetical protein PoB_007693500 [Plakobranchus ocellatus]